MRKVGNPDLIRPYRRLGSYFNCLVCGKVFWRKPYEIKKGNNKFCSRKCCGTSIKGKKPSEERCQEFKKFRGPLAHNWKGGLPRCVECGTTLSTRTAKRCRKCSGIPLRGKVPKNFQLGKKGTENHNWKGGVTSQDKIERLKFITQVRKLVFERDNYTCQMCGVRGGYLQVDHIQSWADYIELRFSMDNCRTLCQSCHYKITYGREMSERAKTWGNNFKYLEREG